MIIRAITLLEAQYIAHVLAVELMSDHSEPIPPFETVNIGKLDSCLNAPFQTFNGRYLYLRFDRRLAILFYLITKNHCFSNGNKRMAVTLCTVFCFVNNRWLDIPPRQLYEVACSVAESLPKNKDHVVDELTKLFRAHVGPLNI